MKGQVNLELGGKTYTARLTVDSIMAIETATNQGIIKLAQSMSEGDLRMQDLLQILYLGLRNGGNDYTEIEVKKIIQDCGMVATTQAVATLLTKTLTVDSEEDTEGKSKKEL
tara:strand:+ start:3513 stop:3848 length:336 start_codon:yes stop_codon:yes gene_type:complete